MISKEALPEPRITAARSTTAGTGPASRMSPTSLREAMWAESSTPAGWIPPRYTMRRIPARAAAPAKACAPSRSRCAKRSPPPIAWIR